jgi:hypothetical protein
MFLEILRNPRKTSVSTACSPANIPTEHLPNTILERYRYTNLLYKKDIEINESGVQRKRGKEINEEGGPRLLFLLVHLATISITLTV